MADPTPVTLDAAALRVLAHPMRLTFLEHLRQHGPATARQLATRFELDSGAASYHLRRLAAGGLIDEDAERGNRRERWWRAVHDGSLHDPAELPEAREESRAYVQALVLAYADGLHRIAGRVPDLTDDWFDASVFSDHTLRLSPAGLDALKRELHDVIARHSVVSPTEDSENAPVSVRLQAFPV